jgi:hypothetical protein
VSLPSRHLRRLSYFPLTGEPGREFTDLCRWQVDQQLGEIKLRIHIMSTACACQILQCGGTRPPRGLPTNKELFQHGSFCSIILEQTFCERGGFDRYKIAED